MGSMPLLNLLKPMLKHNYSFEALGTKWAIETDDEVSSSLKKSIQDRIEEFDKVYSRFREDSLVTDIAKKPGEYEFPPDAKKLFDFYRNLYDATNGKVTPLIGDMLSRAGYDAKYSLQPKTQKPIANWEAAMQWDGLKLTTTQPITLDVGAAGKGYMVDIIAEILDANSINEYVIDASGDIRHKGSSENKVGLEDPTDPTKVIGVVDIQNKSLCASASNRRAWGDELHHIFDPDMMSPVRDIIATWVIADDAMVADGLATALFFIEAKSLREKYEYDYVRLHADGSADYSHYFKDKLF
jgi:thiamine biosynthesis lipoprotein